LGFLSAITPHQALLYLLHNAPRAPVGGAAVANANGAM